MQILVKRIKLYFNNNGDAPAGTEQVFNILDNVEFSGKYGYMNYRNFPMYAKMLCDKWNKQQPNNWRYEIVGG